MVESVKKKSATKTNKNRPKSSINYPGPSSGNCARLCLASREAKRRQSLRGFNITWLAGLNPHLSLINTIKKKVDLYME